MAPSKRPAPAPIATPSAVLRPLLWPMIPPAKPPNAAPPNDSRENSWASADKSVAASIAKANIFFMCRSRWIGRLSRNPIQIHRSAAKLASKLRVASARIPRPSFVVWLDTRCGRHDTLSLSKLSLATAATAATDQSNLDPSPPSPPSRDISSLRFVQAIRNAIKAIIMEWIQILLTSAPTTAPRNCQVNSVSLQQRYFVHHWCSTRIRDVDVTRLSAFPN